MPGASPPLVRMATFCSLSIPRWTSLVELSVSREARWRRACSWGSTSASSSRCRSFHVLRRPVMDDNRARGAQSETAATSHCPSAQHSDFRLVAQTLTSGNLWLGVQAVLELQAIMGQDLSIPEPVFGRESQESTLTSSSRSPAATQDSPVGLQRRSSTRTAPPPRPPPFAGLTGSTRAAGSLMSAATTSSVQSPPRPPPPAPMDKSQAEFEQRMRWEAGQARYAVRCGRTSDLAKIRATWGLIPLTLRDRTGRSILAYAALNGQLECLQFLLDAGCRDDASRSAWWAAADPSLKDLIARFPFGDEAERENPGCTGQTQVPGRLPAGTRPHRPSRPPPPRAARRRALPTTPRRRRRANPLSASAAASAASAPAVGADEPSLAVSDSELVARASAMGFDVEVARQVMVQEQCSSISQLVEALLASRPHGDPGAASAAVTASTDREEEAGGFSSSCHGTAEAADARARLSASVAAAVASELEVADFDSIADRDTCKICFDELADIAFVPCGHLGFCEACCEILDLCPICREKITQQLKIFRV
eukprot:m.35421 g.35421  ORF g.35421 m.35421 type:complete len:540 (+) comp5719_c0_seq1:2319-3938(+)